MVHCFADWGSPRIHYPLYKAAEQLHKRPFSYLHADLHRKNLMVNKQGEIVVLDWELLHYGDPLADAVDHVTRIRYNEEQKGAFWRSWARKMPKKFTKGWKKDKHIYEMFQTIREALVMSIRCTEAIAMGKMKLDEPQTLRNLHKLQNALNKAGRNYWGWTDDRKNFELHELFQIIDHFTKTSRKPEIMKIRREQKEVFFFSIYQPTQIKVKTPQEKPCQTNTLDKNSRKDAHFALNNGLHLKPYKHSRSKW